MKKRILLRRGAAVVVLAAVLLGGKVHSQLRRETVATHSLLYTWQGSDPTREPILLMGHPGRFSAEPSALSNIFRFLPVRLGPRDLARMHGTNERIAVRVYEEAVRLYRQLIREAT